MSVTPERDSVLVVGLVPAAGASRRLGQDKRRLPFRGATVLEAAVDSLRRGGVGPLVVVLDPDSPCRALAGLADVLLVENPHPERGMLSSIRVGLARIPEAAAAVAVLPGDHPFVPPAAVAALVACFAARRPALLVPRYAGRRGHPLLLRRDLLLAAAACDDAVGLQQLVEQRADELLELDLPLPAATEDDLDAPGDLGRLTRDDGGPERPS